MDARVVHRLDGRSIYEVSAHSAQSSGRSASVSGALFGSGAIREGPPSDIRPLPPGFLLFCFLLFGSEIVVNNFSSIILEILFDSFPANWSNPHIH
jgi:hypothetical protein